MVEIMGSSADILPRTYRTTRVCVTVVVMAQWFALDFFSLLPSSFDLVPYALSSELGGDIPGSDGFLEDEQGDSIRISRLQPSTLCSMSTARLFAHANMHSCGPLLEPRCVWTVLKRFKFLRVIRCFRLVKLVRLLRASRLMARWETRVSINYSMLSIWKVIRLPPTATIDPEPPAA